MYFTVVRPNFVNVVMVISISAYVFYSGQTKLTSDPYLHSMQYPDYYPLPDVEDLERVEARESLRRYKL